MMRYVVFDLQLFTEGDVTNRRESEDTLLWLMGVLVDRNMTYLRRHPNTPKLYDSGVRYALPEQMSNGRIDPSKFASLRNYLASIGAAYDTVEAIESFLKGVEVFRDIPRIIDKKEVDCDNIAAWRVAELRLAGVAAVPYITWREKDGGTTYHALVRWPDGTSEDPSILLGMGGAAKNKERAEEKRKNLERFDDFVAVAKALCNTGEDPRTLGKQVHALGLVPSKGRWVGESI